MAKTLRRGKVPIDWSQNSDFKTTVCVYGMRAKREEPFICMPIYRKWKLHLRKHLSLTWHHPDEFRSEQPLSL
jgi:DNA primase